MEKEKKDRKQAKITQPFGRANSNLNKGAVLNGEDYEVRFYQ